MLALLLHRRVALSHYSDFHFSYDFCLHNHEKLKMLKIDMMLLFNLQPASWYIMVLLLFLHKWPLVNSGSFLCQVYME